MAATMITKARMRGTFDTAVMRWIHQCSTPCPEAPRPFTRASGVRMETRVSALLSAMVRSPLERDEGDDPDRQRERDRADEGEAGHVDALGRLHAVAEIPDQVAHAAQHVVHEDPGVAEEDQVPEGRAEEPLHGIEGFRTGGQGHEPDRKQRDAAIE